MEVLSSDLDFGVLTLAPNTSDEWTPFTGLCIHLSIDTSASMRNMCADGASQMEHIKAMLRNFVSILKRVSDHGRTVLIQLQTFNDHLEVNLPLVDMSVIAMADIETVIHHIQPSGATDLGVALQSNNELFQMMNDVENKSTFLHVVMTDGYITSGIREADDLRHMTSTNCPTVFIGCGLHHDAALMYTLGSGGGNVHHRYRAITTFDQAGLVCGDVLNSVMDVSIKDIYIACEGCEVYNHATSTWGNTLEVDVLVRDTPRQFHLRGRLLEEGGTTAAPAAPAAPAARVVVSGVILATGNAFTQVVRRTATPVDLRVYLWRQKVLELLHDATQYLNAQRFRAANHAETAELESRMADAFGVLRTFVTDNDLHISDLYKTLCDDLYIAHRCISDQNVERARIYTVARAVTQGDQTAFSLNYDRHTEDMDGLDLGLGPLDVGDIGGGVRGIVGHLDYDPTPSSVFSTPFASQNATEMMRGVSGRPL
jgi:uncharacterized protein YegL